MGALLTTFGIDWHALVAEVVNFAILIALLTWLLYKPVLKMIRDREELIAKGVDDAAAAAKKLAEADGEAHAKLTVAETEAEKIVLAARDNATSEKTRIVADANSRAAAHLADAEARAKEAHAKALRDSEKEIARLSILAAEKVLRQKA